MCGLADWLGWSAVVVRCTMVVLHKVSCPRVDGASSLQIGEAVSTLCTVAIELRCAVVARRLSASRNRRRMVGRDEWGVLAR